MPIKWDAQADAKLLVGIVTTSCQSVDYHAIAEFMGEGVTVNAVRLHIRTLKERAGVIESPSKGDKAAKDPADGSPKPRKRKSPTKKDSVPKGNGVAKKTKPAKKQKVIKAESPSPASESDTSLTDNFPEVKNEMTEVKTETVDEAIYEA